MFYLLTFTCIHVNTAVFFFFFFSNELIYAAERTAGDHRLTYMPCRAREEENDFLGVYCRGIWLAHDGLRGFFFFFLQSTFCAHSDDDFAPRRRWSRAVHYLDNYCSVRRWKRSSTQCCGRCFLLHGAAHIVGGPCFLSSDASPIWSCYHYCDSQLSSQTKKKKKKRERNKNE